MRDRSPNLAPSRRAHVAAVGWTSLVLVLLLMPGSQLQNPSAGLPFGLPPWSDKVVHALLFFFEAMALDRSWRRLRRFSQPLRSACMAAVGLGVGTELLQLLIPARGLEGGDLLVNVGAVLFYGLLVSRYAMGGKTG